MRPRQSSSPSTFTTYVEWASQVEQDTKDLNDYSVQMHNYAAAHPEDSAAQERAAQARKQHVQALWRWAADVRQLAAHHPNDSVLGEYAKQVQLTPARFADALAQAAARNPADPVLQDYATKMRQELAAPSPHMSAEVQPTERERAITNETYGWVQATGAVRTHRTEATKKAYETDTDLRRAVVEVRYNNEVAWRVMLLPAKDAEKLRDHALAERTGLAARLADLGRSREVLPVSAFAGLAEAITSVQGAASCGSGALSAGNEVRRTETARILSDMPVDRLKEVTRERINTEPLTRAGLSTVKAVLHYEGLQNLEGIGPTLATRIGGAAQTLWQTIYDEMPARIDVKNRSVETTEFLCRLRVWDAVRKNVGDSEILDIAAEFGGLAWAIEPSVTHAVVFCASQWSVGEFLVYVNTIVCRAQLIADRHESLAVGDPWDDFLARPADYFALLAELGFITEDTEKARGDLPDDIVEAVRALELKTEYLSASLRGYQSFGARFALAQRRVIIGDEMGLGKTIEAIAVFSHLRAKGFHRFLVICPAAVVTNWTREVSSKSTLAAHRLHGPDRGAAARSWRRIGGVAVTTFDTLTWLHQNVADLQDLACVVVDEAHYVKNPDALRTRNSLRLLNSCERVVLLTGTPLENRIDDFRNLVSYLRPDLLVDASELAPRKFRRQVAPAYLRRNQEDVLTELPELVEVDEWLPMSDEDAAAYRDAVEAGNFMAMRQAATTQGGKSNKMQRLIELVAEAEENGRRVVVFSYFRDIVNEIARALPGQVFGPLTGSVSAHHRQTMVDQFSAAGHGAVLVSQIVAGGVGLNIQAASVVIICEPQLKPTTEWQAVGRARRMGQLESVQVHRLLSEEGVDQRIRDILARKRELFEEFARKSETADSAPEAYDVSEAELAREVIAAERERLFGQTA
jgi:superfamily II DNA or RNA helicase